MAPETKPAAQTGAERPPAWAMLVPWVDVFLIAAATLAFGLAATVQPGIPVDLPTAAGPEGAPMRPSIVVTLRPAPDGGALAFFRDGRYALGATRSEAQFVREVAKAVAETAGQRHAIIHADGAIPHAQALKACALLREAGMERVWFATRPAAAAGTAAEAAREAPTR